MHPKPRSSQHRNRPQQTLYKLLRLCPRYQIQPTRPTITMVLRGEWWHQGRQSRHTDRQATTGPGNRYRDALCFGNRPGPRKVQPCSYSFVSTFTVDYYKRANHWRGCREVCPLFSERCCHGRNGQTDWAEEGGGQECEEGYSQQRGAKA